MAARLRWASTLGISKLSLALVAPLLPPAHHVILLDSPCALEQTCLLAFLPVEEPGDCLAPTPTLPGCWHELWASPPFVDDVVPFWAGARCEVKSGSSVLDPHHLETRTDPSSCSFWVFLLPVPTYKSPCDHTEPCR